ncbi:MAG: DNA-3-methyladenine glycosylase I [Anaerolineae bacterium]|nr:DNA-3-methyladenine glycosylase I [Anaerolineae bacterium]
MALDIPPELIPEEERGYHIPPRIKPKDDNGYFEIIAQATFQAGFSWAVVRRKWPNFRKAFDGFDIDRVARYDTDDLDRLLADPGIIRNGQKIEATFHNARVMQRIIDEYGAFHDYLRSMDGESYEVRNKRLRDQFKWLGRTGVYFLLWCVDEDVPHWENR